jgi:hypothetical protein
MKTNAPPSRNPADASGDMPGGLRTIFGKWVRSSLDDMLPCEIVTYDRAKNRATIKHMLAMVATNGDIIRRNQLASIPVLNIGGGDFILSFNLKPGNKGWIKAADRDIAEFLNSYSEAIPATKRVHNFSNGLFIPDVMTGWDIATEDAENAVLQNLSGTVKISLGSDSIKIKAPTLITIEAATVEVNATTVNANVSGNMTAEVDGQLIVNAAAFQLNGNTDYLVKYNFLLAQLQSLVGQFNLHWHDGTNSSKTPEVQQDLTLIANAKAATLKTAG